MYLDATRRLNPGLIRTAARLHQEGAIPANTYVIDLDSVRRNAAALVSQARDAGVGLYLMTKHVNRNPIVTHVALACGIPSTVAVDVQCALALNRFDLPVGHVGHLVQIPRNQLTFVLGLHPEVMTIFSLEKARQISEAALALGMRQDILLRVRGEDDIIYPNEEGGIWENELEDTARSISGMGGVRIAGVVTFPATLYSPATRASETTPNFETMLRAKERLLAWGFDIEQVNSPGGTWSGGLHVVGSAGGTVAEPGHALTGTTPPVLDGIAAESPAMVYVSEVSHLFDGRAYVMGGGFYACDTPASQGDDRKYHTPPWRPRALVGRDPEEILNSEVTVDVDSFFARTRNATDYYGGTLLPDTGVEIRVGDSAVYGFRPQAFTMRANVAVVDHVDSAARVVGIFDRANNLVDAQGRAFEDTVPRVKALLKDLG